MLSIPEGRLDQERVILLDLVERDCQVYGQSHINTSPVLGRLIALLRTQGDFAAIRDLSQGWMRELLDMPRETEPLSE